MNKSTYIGIFGMLITTIFIGVWITLVLSHVVPFTKGALWFLAPFVLSSYLIIGDDKAVIRQMNSLWKVFFGWVDKNGKRS